MPGAVARRNPVFAGLAAERWARDNGIVSLPVRPKEIAEGLDIVVRAKSDAAQGVSGMLLRHGNEFAICYATRVKSVGFQNFSVAHELGHYLLDGHPEHIFAHGGVHMSQAGFTSADPYEAEADHFAAGLMMPDYLFDPALRTTGEGLSAVEALSRLCKTSLTSTAIRYAQRTTVPAAVVVSTGGRIDYCFMSKAMKDFDALNWPRKGDLLPGGVATERFSRTASNVSDGRRLHEDGDLKDWFGGRKVAMEEEALGLGSYGKVLTVITAGSFGEDGDDDDDLQERWTPRFRR